MYARLLILLCFSFLLIACAGPSKADPNKLVDEIFATWNKPGTPGAAIAVIEHGNLVFNKGYGIANLEYDIPITPETVFDVGSVSKQFTAMAVVLLEQDKKLSLDDDVHKYLPELPDYGAKITIRNMLQHTSGVRDSVQTLALAGWNIQKDLVSQDQILRMLFRQKRLNFPPGSAYLYSNGSFTLLAEIVQRVGGITFPLFCEERIFRPLGMTRTHFHQDLQMLVHGRAYSYSGENGAYVAEPLNTAQVGATSLFTTAADLTKWLDNFRAPKVGGAPAVARLQEEGVLSNGKKIDYGLGIFLGTYRGLHTVSHGGTDAGYRSHVLWFPDEELGIAIVSNLGNFGPGIVANKVAAVYLGNKMTPEPKPEAERTFIALDPKELESYVGAYPLPTIWQTSKIVMKEGKLYDTDDVTDRSKFMELKAVGPAHFYNPLFGGIDYEFTSKPDSGMAVKITQNGRIFEGVRVLSTIAPKEFPQYAGVYWSEELETQYTLFVRDGKLLGVHARHGEFELTPFIRDQFTTKLYFMLQVKFVRDQTGRLTGATFGGDGVQQVDFVRR